MRLPDAVQVAARGRTRRGRDVAHARAARGGAQQEDLGEDDGAGARVPSGAGRANGGLFFMPVLSALAFSGRARDDIKRGIAGCLASRSSLRSYLVANIVLTYVAGFLLVFGMLLLLQLLAFVAFPVDGVYGGYLDTPIYIEVIPDDGLMYDLRMDSPYLYNAVFAIWSAGWAGACSLISFGLTFIVGRHKALPLALPTLVSLALFQFAPMVVDSASGYLHFPYCYPDIASQAGDSVYFAGLLLIMTVLSLAASFAPFAKGKDVLL